MSEVIHIRLINQDEIIGQIFNEDDNRIFIRNPLIVEEKMDSKTNQSMVVLSRYILFHDVPIEFKKTHIVTFSGVLPEIEDYYFNSLEYNRKIIEPRILGEIRRINETMASYLTEPEEEEDSETLMVPAGHLILSSNTVH